MRQQGGKARTADIFIGHRSAGCSGGGTIDLRMRRARRADLAVIWPATLQTVWDDLPEDERAGLDRRTWENHFRKKIEAVVEGNRTERWIAERPSGETLGYVILGASGVLTPET